ncbi:hypothetical protein [Jeotgalibacillus soli]|uniref:Uncharacterized protein n=1 Tax=Jeotgalibacillus soli TaxID=889306 RepID=A0A0C2W0A2_9BACL|nr:hypothetical protein [Jeotgalibacillus soli]KIL50036.1 hypothetical protein KP78_15040 [Jeotgalibacillus soli]
MDQNHESHDFHYATDDRDESNNYQWSSEESDSSCDDDNQPPNDDSDTIAAILNRLFVLGDKLQVFVGAKQINGTGVFISATNNVLIWADNNGDVIFQHIGGGLGVRKVGSGKNKDNSKKTKHSKEKDKNDCHSKGGHTLERTKIHQDFGSQDEITNIESETTNLVEIADEQEASLEITLLDHPIEKHNENQDELAGEAPNTGWMH